MNGEGYTLPEGPVAEISGTISALEKRLAGENTTVGSEIPFLLMEAERNRAVMEALDQAFNDNSRVTWLDFVDSVGNESRAGTLVQGLKTLLTTEDDKGRYIAAKEVLRVVAENARTASHEEPYLGKSAA